MLVAGCPSMMVCSLVDFVACCPSMVACSFVVGSVCGVLLGEKFSASAFLFAGVLPATTLARKGVLEGAAAGLCFVGDVSRAVVAAVNLVDCVRGEGCLSGVLAAEALAAGAVGKFGLRVTVAAACVLLLFGGGGGAL